jgi:hypothetical protein
MCEMKHSSKYLDSTPTVHEETKVKHGIQNKENKRKSEIQKQNQGDKSKY